MKQLVALVAIASTLVGGCRLLETGYGDENVMVRTTADSVSASASALKSSTSWAGAKVQSFGDDLDSDLHALFIYIGDPVSAIPGTQLVGNIYEVDNLRMANHAIYGLLIDMRRRAEGRRAGWLRDLFDD